MPTTIPADKILKSGNEIEEIVKKLNRLTAEADSVNGGIGRCYMQGGVGGRMAEAVSAMKTNAGRLSAGAGNLVTAAGIYKNTEEQLAELGKNAAGAIKEGYNVSWAARPAVGAVLAASAADGALPAKKDIFSDNIFGRAARKGTQKIISIAGKMKQNYKNHGFLYKAHQYGKCALKVGSAVVKIVGAVGVFQTGVGIPVAITSIISAGNDIVNAATDAALVHEGLYDSVGTTNYLKDTLVEKGGEIGEYFGNREAGELFGRATYTGLDAVSLLNGAEKMLKSYGVLNADLTGVTGPSKIFGDISFDDILDREYKWYDMKDNIKRIFMGAGSTADFVTTAADKTYSTIKKAYKFGNELFDLANY